MGDKRLATSDWEVKAPCTPEVTGLVREARDGSERDKMCFENHFSKDFFKS